MRGVGDVEDVDGDCPPPDERSIGDDGGDDFPSRREVSSAEQLRQSPSVTPPIQSYTNHAHKCV